MIGFIGSGSGCSTLTTMWTKRFSRLKYKLFHKLCFRRFDANRMFSILIYRWNKNPSKVWLGSQNHWTSSVIWLMISFHWSTFGSNNTLLINEGKNRCKHPWEFVFVLMALVSSLIYSVSHWDLQTCISRALLIWAFACSILFSLPFGQM